MVKGKTQKRQNVDSTKRRQNWNQSEVEQLTQAVQKCGMNWFEIAKFMPKRSPNQCAQKWKNIKGFRSRQNRFWTQEEDSLLIQFVGQVGKNWAQIASLMQHRNNRQCRDRYFNTLDPALNQEVFTPEEDMLVYEKFLLFGPKWCWIQKELPGRSDNQVKNRFYTHIRPKFFNIGNPYYSKISAEEAKENLEIARQNHFQFMTQGCQQETGSYGEIETMEDNMSELILFSSRVKNRKRSSEYDF